MADDPHPHDPDADPADAAWERPVDKFRRTAAGSVVAAGLLGLRDVMEGRPEKEETSIVSEAPTRPVGALDVVIDLDHPERNIAIVRRRPADGEAPPSTGDRTPPPSP
jgi:hypothetical protein